MPVRRKHVGGVTGGAVSGYGCILWLNRNDVSFKKSNSVITIPDILYRGEVITLDSLRKENHQLNRRRVSCGSAGKNIDPVIPESFSGILYDVYLLRF